MSKDLVRVSLMIRKDQHEKMKDMDANISGYIRNLVDDDMSDHTITVAVKPETKMVYDQIISHTGEGDEDFEPYIKQALKAMLTDKIKKLQKFQREL